MQIDFKPDGGVVLIVDSIYAVEYDISDDGGSVTGHFTFTEAEAVDLLDTLLHKYGLPASILKE